MKKEKEVKSKKEEIVVNIGLLDATFVFLAIAFLATSFQFFQLSSLDAALEQQGSEIKGIATEYLSLSQTTLQPATNKQPTSGIPDSLKNVPDMVGGC